MESDKESQKIILPKQLFRNWFTWFLYEIFKCNITWLASGLCLVVSFVFYKRNFVYKDVLVGAMISGTFLAIALMIPVYGLLFLKDHLKNKTDLSQQVWGLSPGLDIEKWDLISSRLNIKFYQERIWNTPYFFFDGQNAQWFFKNRVLKSYLEGKFDDATDMDQIESSKNYLKSVTETFDSHLKEDLPELVSELELPREANRSRFFSNPGYLMKLYLFCCFEVEPLVFLIMAISKKSHLLLCFAICFQFQSFSLYRNYRRFIYPLISVMQGIKFMTVITKVNPGQSLAKWDEIARYMNQCLADEGNFEKRNVKFFDGKHCLNFYKRYFEPLLVGNSWFEFGDLKEVVDVVQQYVE